MNNPIYAHDTLEFVTVAAEYCALLEGQGAGGKEQDELVGTLLKLLPLLYMKVQLLPEETPSGSPSMGRNEESLALEGEVWRGSVDRVTEDDYNYVRDGLYSLLHEHDEYEMLVWDEDMQTEESRWCSVSEGLADIYQALRNFVAVYQQRVEPCMLDALWQVREDFELYWGQTLLDTLRQLHKIKYRMYEGDK